ncbi:MAG: exodeoxyribonuclease VII large subunit [Bacilli bacterium]|nr:exodeoxyribonuclease VII large subunit [Bacilli bacterium]
MNNNYISVGALTRYIKYKIDNDVNLQEVYIKGEISNFKRHSRGHFYFTIKDEESRINAIMFSSQTKNVNFEPMDGTKVLVKGRISVFEQTGNYQIYVSEMMEDGVGNLYALYEKLKQDLKKEGLFDESHKKKIPLIPSRVGVVTAPTGAAIRDIISTINRRYPLCEVILFPSLVQGKEAKDDIVKNIKLADTYNLDTLIVGRGGGSIEDLWAFNEEIVARAIYECKTPVISAVGHEVDFTIADFVSDVRAATPTGAAEIAVPDKGELKKIIKQLELRSSKNINNIINYNKTVLEKIKTSYILKNPMSIYEIKEQKLSNIMDKLNNYISNYMDNKKLRLDNILSSYILTNPTKIYENKQNRYNHLIEKLEVLNPLNTLKRGYSITKFNDKVIKDIKDVKVDDNINISLDNGNIDAKIIGIKENINE